VEVSTGQRSDQLNYVPTCQINEMLNSQCLYGLLRLHIVHCLRGTTGIARIPTPASRGWHAVLQLLISFSISFIVVVNYCLDRLEQSLQFEVAIVPLAIDKKCRSSVHPAAHAAGKVPLYTLGKGARP
jgi:hypothetical protein